MRRIKTIHYFNETIRAANEIRGLHLSCTVGLFGWLENRFKHGFALNYNTTWVNTTARNAQVIDLKSLVLGMLVNQLGLGNPHRFAFTITGTNTGTITGATTAINIVNDTAPITITNTGLIDGTVILDDSILRLNGLTSRVTGAVTGGAGSTVTVNGTFTTENTFGVDNFTVRGGGAVYHSRNVLSAAVVTNTVLLSQLGKGSTAY